jgi:hypothetical protein
MSIGFKDLLTPLLGGVIGMLSKPEEPEAPKVPEQTIAAPKPTAKGDTTAGGTLLTGAAGVTGAAPTAKKSLLGQ